MEQEHASLLADAHFWVLVATTAFAVLAFVKGRRPLLALLDARTSRIRAELEEAKNLRAEAQELLDDCLKKNQDALATSQKIITDAHHAADRLQKDAARKLDESMKRKEELLLERITRAEAVAMQELRDRAADIAAKSAEALLRDILPQHGGKLVSDSIKDIPSKLKA